MSPRNDERHLGEKCSMRRNKSERGSPFCYRELSSTSNSRESLSMDCFIKLFHYSGFGLFSQSEPEETLGMGKYVNVVYMVKGCLEKSSLEGCTWEIPGVFLITTLDPHRQKFRGSLVERTGHTKVWRQSLLSTSLSLWAPFYQKL